jgi:hypothetical protein
VLQNLGQDSGPAEAVWQTAYKAVSSRLYASCDPTLNEREGSATDPAPFGTISF